MKIKEIDVHGMSSSEAKKYINQILNSLSKDIQILTIIHGYHSGNALAKMIRANFKKHQKVDKIIIGLNQGSTDLILK